MSVHSTNQSKLAHNKKTQKCPCAACMCEGVWYNGVGRQRARRCCNPCVPQQQETTREAHGRVSSRWGLALVGALQPSRHRGGGRGSDCNGDKEGVAPSECGWEAHAGPCVVSLWVRLRSDNAHASRPAAHAASAAHSGAPLPHCPPHACRRLHGALAARQAPAQKLQQ